MQAAASFACFYYRVDASVSRVAGLLMYPLCVSGVDQGLLCAWFRLALNLLVARACGCVLDFLYFCLASCMGFN